MTPTKNQHITFFKAVLNHSKTVGSFWPSSDSLVKELNRAVAEDQQKPKHILEVGGGTGVITKDLLSLLKPEDTLDIIEFLPIFAEDLKRLVERLGKKKQVNVYQMKFEDFEFKKNYTHIISSLPLSNFETTTVVDIYGKFKTLLSRGATLSYVEYQGITTRLNYYKLFKQSDYKRLDAILKVKGDLLKETPHKTRTIFSNFPPARVYHVKEASYG